MDDEDDNGGGDVGLKVGEVFRRPSSLFNNLFMSFLKHSLAFTHNGDDQHDKGRMHTSYLSHFLHNHNLRPEILHLKVRKCATKVVSRQNSVD